MSASLPQWARPSGGRLASVSQSEWQAGGRSWRVRGGGWVRTTSRPSPLEPTSGQPSGADALVRGTQGRPSVVTRRDRTRRDGDRRSPRFSICLPTALGRMSPRRERSTGATTRLRAAPIPMPRPRQRAAQLALRKPDRGAIFFAGEALYAGPEMGTVEAALASGQETAQMILAAGP